MDYKEKVIALLNSKELSKEQKEKLEDIFPELREPEDERIKSAAIEFVIQNKSFNYYLGISKDDVVTWINRQGEQKAWTEEDKNMLKWVIGYLENKMLNTPISEERIACKNAIAWLLEKQAQKSAAWSEEDARLLDNCISLIEDIDCTGEEQNWLKSLKDRVQPQSQWKPSEQDILLLERIFDGKLDPRDFQALLQGIIEQLKKLREE